MLLGVLGVVLAWTAQQTIDRLDSIECRLRTLECQTTRILTRLDMPTSRGDTLDFGVKPACWDLWPGNQRNQENQTTPFSLDEPMVHLVGYKCRSNR